MIDHFETYFDAYYAYFTQTMPILKRLGQFENLVFEILSTRENIRLIARAPLQRLQANTKKIFQSTIHTTTIHSILK